MIWIDVAFLDPHHFLAHIIICLKCKCKINGIYTYMNNGGFEPDNTTPQLYDTFPVEQKK